MSDDELWKKLKRIEKKMRKRSQRRGRIRPLSPSSSKSVAQLDEEKISDVVMEEEHTDTHELKEDGLTELDDTILSALGNPSSSEKTYADDIHPEIIKRVENILTSGIDKETRDDLCKKYLIPKKLMLLDAPKLNMELEGLLSDLIKERDKRVEERQQQLGIALSALLSVVDNLIKTKQNTNNIGTLTDISRVLSDLHYNDTCTRRKLVAINLDKNIIKTTDAAKRDSFLFAEKFNEKVKSANAIKKAAPSILKKSNFIRKAVQPKQSNYYYKNKENFNTPSHSSRAKQGRGGQVSTEEQREAPTAEVTIRQDIPTQICASDIEVKTFACRLK